MILSRDRERSDAMQTGYGFRALGALSGIAAGFGFFLPWIRVTPDLARLDAVARYGVSEWIKPFVGGVSARFSGFELASGPRAALPAGLSWEAGATPELWAVVAAAIVALVMVLSGVPRPLVGFGFLGAGGGGLAFMLLGLQRLEDARLPLTAVSNELGLWIAAAGLIGLIVCGLLALATDRADRRVSRAMPYETVR
jgi:hypothetical protein